MKTSSEDPLVSASAGVTKGALSWTEEKINKLLVKFHNRDIAFVEDPETINLAKKQRKTSEWHFFKALIEDTGLRVLFLMGLTLRKLEKQRARPKIEALREKILDRYDIEGLHIAQLIQNGFFSKFLGNVLERAPTTQRLKFEMETLFNNVETAVVFVKETDSVDWKTQEIVTKILANSPSIFVICGSGYARGKLIRIKGMVMKLISDYSLELYEARYKQMYFLNKLEESSQ